MDIEFSRIPKHKTVALAQVVALALLGLVINSCATSGGSQAMVDPAGSGLQRDPQNTPGHLSELIAARNRDTFADTFTIGPGDLLEVSVPDAPELRDQTVRVSTDGTISLPLTGTLNAAGLTEEELRAALRKRIAKYVKDPDVKLFVKQYYSRQVAVTGMVQKPGVYTLESRTETLLGVLGQAGGLAENASHQILFIPNVSGRSDATGLADLAANLGRGPVSNADDIGGTSGQRLSAEKPERLVPAKLEVHQPINGQPGPPSMLEQDNAISINLTDQALSEIPVRPGDVIIVPAVGEVMVQGWVVNPGAFKITPGMTALGAIGAAGGPMFSSSAELLRLGPEGTKIRMPIDLSRVRSGEEADVAVQSGDVVIVNPSIVGSVPYGIYTLFNKFGTGMYVVP
jgi:protein involved in polysaccharide export with SLBB domain